jgi:hypothetical protein
MGGCCPFSNCFDVEIFLGPRHPLDGLRENRLTGQIGVREKEEREVRLIGKRG